MTNYKKVNLFLSEELVNKVSAYVGIENQKNSLWRQERRNYIQETDFIAGIIIDFFDEIESNSVSSGFDDLGKPFRLQNNFKEIALKKGMTQKHVADLTNIDPGNISRIWKNQSQPSLDYFLRIWICLNCPPLNKCLYREVEK
ncbi:helix-turn-helix domain-containing protein [Rossellomorea marisflavi]|uniref:helix-turn-helix domain-containing protein n=1 Tax=Rossellomorea marisflavi TaxID=189381 RepID=UPI003FA05FFA